MVPAADGTLVVSVCYDFSASGAGEAGECLFNFFLAGESFFGGTHGLSPLWVSVQVLVCSGEDVFKLPVEELVDVGVDGVLGNEGAYEVSFVVLGCRNGCEVEVFGGGHDAPFLYRCA